MITVAGLAIHVRDAALLAVLVAAVVAVLADETAHATAGPRR
ncbi:hypothetical protein FsymDg_4369 [Candidatus Protofrankia datiscae]|uniref:Uncharacterized protein n=1 Tax=Candidatus Protofrankia datiscae TaxID=2716812 RepID=F8AZ93_9ACTN|nr:hypothetical protein [Candidatus Protofrankia datiscae]AEH07694.1 hypothetical protein FsymDg_0113 [Candidatus Protofrankia datiscae]AEH11622.1 hypothetical protein FsymDg_4369 [Candidatus Protofrankia datiscae]